jgi:hypothetical protein
MLLRFGSEAIIEYAAMPRPMFRNDHCRGTSTDSFRKQRSTMQMANLLRCLDSPDHGINEHCGAPMRNNCQACRCEAVNLTGVSAPRQLTGAANRSETLSICWLHP